MSQISAVIITYNEELNIARCIESLQGIADEILVIDSFSTDTTEEICRKYGVRFLQRKWDNYSAQKNYGNEQATYDYILSMDADEALSGELRNSLIAAKSNLDSAAFSMNRLTFYCGRPIRHCGWYPDRKVRLWNRNVARWEGDVHERLIYLSPVPRQHLRGDILHYSFRSYFQHVEKINKYSEIAANIAFQKNKSSNIFKLVLKPAFKFWHVYLLKGGFLDGYAGYLISKMYAYDAFLRISKLRLMKSGYNRE